MNVISYLIYIYCQRSVLLLKADRQNFVSLILYDALAD